MERLYCSGLDNWRTWLKRNHRHVDGVWLVFYKKGAGEQTLTYSDALDEALCYGWIDSLVKKIDEEKYVRKFTPRNEISIWSAINKNRVERLIKAGRMKKAGLAIVETAKKNGCWDKPDWSPEPDWIPDELEAALKRNAKARANFDKLPPGYRKQYAIWIGIAKRPETRNKRVAEAIRLLQDGRKLGSM